MAKSANQKAKLLYLADIFMRETDEAHGITIARITKLLAEHGISADRKTLYDDIEELRRYGLDIVGEQRERSYYYWIAGRRFELPELRLLADSVHAARFITEGKSRELIEKIGTLASRYEAGGLNRQVYCAGSGKADNENIYYNVDAIHSAVAADRRIRFRYFTWNSRKEAVLRHDGAFYEVSPWTLVWDDEFYYLVAYDGCAGYIKHFRVDKMKDISVCGEAREGGETFAALDMRTYTRRIFSMFSGEEETVTLEGPDSMAGILLDHFGQEIFMEPLDEDRFRAAVRVSVSEQFFGWLFALGGRVRVTAPESVVAQIRELLARLEDSYGRP